jgi:hypothetical protein
LAVPSWPAMGGIGDLSLLKASLDVCEGLVRLRLQTVALIEFEAPGPRSSWPASRAPPSQRKPRKVWRK